MAIERHDRSFEKIFSEITLEKIPADYIEKVSIELVNGTYVELTNEEFSTGDVLASVLGGFSKEEIADVQIAIDYDKIKEDVSHDVTLMLDMFFNQGGPNLDEGPFIDD